MINCVAISKQSLVVKRIVLLNIISLKKAKQVFVNNKFYGFYILMDKLMKEMKFVSYLYWFYYNYTLIK